MSEPSTSSLLTYPAASTTCEESPEPIQSVEREAPNNRLFVGNLHPTVNEYSLIQLFSKYGKVTNLDFLFHKTGLLKGKPRGYAFIEFGDASDARRALEATNGKLLRGRNMVVTQAHHAPLERYEGSGKVRKPVNEAGKPTTLSLIKTGMPIKQQGDLVESYRTQTKIAQMEAKLRQMESTREDAPLSSLPSSLPAKPPPTVTDPRNVTSSPASIVLNAKPVAITAGTVNGRVGNAKSRSLPGVIVKKHKAQ